MKNEYRDFYDGLRFSDEQKEDIKMKLIEQAGKQAASAGASPAGTETVQRRKAPKPFRFAAAAAIVGAIILGGGGVAYATGTLGNVLHFFDEVINGASAQTEIVEKIGRPVGASASDAGITITAEAILGDRSSYAVIYSIEKDDGSPFVTDAIPGTPYLDYMMDGTPASPDLLSSLTAGSGGSGEAYFYDADPSDNAIQYVEKYSLLGDADIIGATLVAEFDEISRMGEGGEWESVARGSWKLRFKADYEDLSREIDASGMRFKLGEGEATMEELRISPIAISLSYVADEPAVFGDEESGRMSEQMSAEMDRLLDLGTITLTMKDGSTSVVQSNSGGSIADDHVSCQQVLFLEGIVDVDEVASITIGGTVFEIAG